MNKYCRPFPWPWLAWGLLCSSVAGRLALPALLAQEPASLSGDADRLAAEVRHRGWVAFGARSPQGDWDLYLCRPDGSERRPLTSTPEYNEFLPLFSRDGRQLLYRRLPRAESIDGNRHGEQGSLIVARSDGFDPRPLGPPGELPWASWGPDGRQIACLSRRGVLFVDVAAGTVLATLPRRGFFQQTTWSPDGQWLCGVANSYGTGWSVARLHVATGEAAPVNTVDCCTPDWFPDSQQLIFSWRPPGQKSNRGSGWTQLWRADARGRDRQLVFGEDGRHVYGGHVSPDGQYVLFTGNVEEDGDPGNAGAPMGLMRLADAPIVAGESRDLRALHPQARSGPFLTLPPGWEPCWTASELPGQRPGSPDRTAAPVGDGGTAATESVKQLAAELRDKGWLVFSARHEQGDWDLYLSRPDGSDRRQLTDTSEFNEAGARFSPDGTRLLFYRMPKSEPVDNNTYGTFELVIARADGTQPEVLGAAFPWASWGPTSREIACLTPRGIQIVTLAARTPVRQLPRRGMVSQLVWSPDGQWFTGTANGLGPFWNIGLLDAGSGAIRPLSETDRYNCTSDWRPNSRQVIYARGIIPQKPGRAELWVASIDGSERRVIHAESGRHIYGACASPDGRYVLFTRSVEDLGKVAGTEMAIVRWPAPGTTPSAAPVRLDLGSGWEPHWSATAALEGGPR